MTDDNKAQNSPFGHLHKAIDIATKPSEELGDTDQSGWAYEKDSLKQDEAAVKAKFAQAMLLTLTDIKKDEVSTIAAEITIAKMYNDLPALDFVINMMRLRKSVKAKMHNDLIKVVTDSAQKISSPISLQPIRKLLRGGGGANDEPDTGA